MLDQFATQLLANLISTAPNWFNWFSDVFVKTPSGF